MRRAAASLLIVVAVVALVVVGTGASGGSTANPTYHIELDNAFGLVTGANFKVSGVPAGTLTGLSLDQKTLNAVATVSVSNVALSRFHTSATCQSEPQSLIGEYFISCDPGTSGPLLKSGATIPVSHTQSTIPADLLLDVLQVPEQQRLPLIIDSLGAGVASRSTDLQVALDRAVPALTETDDLLNLLANDSSTLKQLTVNSDTVLTALANNSGQVQRFIDAADRASTDTATEQANLQRTLHDLPAFLSELRPRLAQLDGATRANLPVLDNLDRYSGDLDTLFTELPGFSRSAIPAIRALGKASVTGRAAVIAARPTVGELNALSVHTPELAKNLSIVTPDLDTLKNVTETNARSPGGKGYTGLEALLEFVFNLSGAINYYGPTGHMLAVDGFVSAMCTPYATPQTIADNLAMYGAAYRQCYAWLGKNQPGVNETDPSDPTACVADPGGAPTGETGPTTSACALAPQSGAASVLRRSQKAAGPEAGSGSSGSGGSSGTSSGTSSASSGQSAGSSGVASAVSGATQTVTHTLSTVGGAIGSVLSVLGGNTGTTTGSSSTSTTAGTVLGLHRSARRHHHRAHPATTTTTTTTSQSTTSMGDAESLLRYLLAS